MRRVYQCFRLFSTQIARNFKPLEIAQNKLFKEITLPAKNVRKCKLEIGPCIHVRGAILMQTV